MSYNAKLDVVDGKLCVEVSDDSIDLMVVTALLDYRKLLKDSMTYEADQCIAHGSVQDFQVSNVKENLQYLQGIDCVLDYLGASDAE